ncbi:hypothetical protein C8034_v010270 [Colletotrichum sidae]|uniref:Uncharacterized protein n=2 Tax=Colletotrichum orbiculare species complex TaxID=2707354 RepID=A0A4R8QBA9_9PEZI|nr:hypothetical protein C8035_v008400 [Colletotrichum spinosum]TEA19161.1 hypothetical protein C8034_v010270 [Colletotrichum sidae]
MDHTLEEMVAYATKEELMDVVLAIGRAHVNTRDRVIGVLEYLHAMKIAKTCRRRSNRLTPQDDCKEEPIEPKRVPQSVKKSDIKICMNCSSAFREKENSLGACSFHPGHWLIEVEDDDTIGYISEARASDEVKQDESRPRIAFCCNAERGLVDGCVTGAKHIAMKDVADITNVSGGLLQAPKP